MCAPRWPNHSTCTFWAHLSDRCWPIRGTGHIRQVQPLEDQPRARTGRCCSSVPGSAVGTRRTSLIAVQWQSHDEVSPRALLREALTTYRVAGDRQGIALGLEGGARLAASTGRTTQAVRTRAGLAAARVPLGLRIQAHTPFLRDLAARIFGLGLWPAQVQSRQGGRARSFGAAFAARPMGSVVR